MLNRYLLVFTVFISGFGLWMVLSPPQAESANHADIKALIQLPDVQITVDQVVASGFSSPVQVTNAGDGSGRLFVVEQTGKIRIIKNGAVHPSAFLNLSSLIACCGERGLLGVAFHPDYSSNGFFFVDYTRAGDGATVVARYSVSGDPDLADPNSAQIILTIPQPYANHNGGQVMFGPDGYLYIGTGDGGSGGDPQDNAQNINSLLGKLLRLDVNNGLPYAIPPGNPFVGVPGANEIWAYGLRNPWRYSFDRFNGDLYLGDVGQNLYEEIDFQAANTPGGLNFGWRCKEGFHDYNTTNCTGKQLTDPIAEYSHSAGLSVTGGFVYQGTDFLALQGRYFYADYAYGKIWSLYKTGTNPTTWSTPELELDTGFNISSFGEDENGELYVVDYSGKIRRLADVNGPSPNLSSSRKLVSSPSANPSDTITYTIRITNTGGMGDRAVIVTDTVPGGLSYIPGSLWASSGVWSDADVPVLSWQGNLIESQGFTITYQVSVTGEITGSIINQAQVSAPPEVFINLDSSLSVPATVLTSTMQDFYLPGTQPGAIVDEIRPSVDCDICHSAPIYNSWRGSMMSQAGRDPLMWAALHVANIDAPNSGEFCLRCHTGRGWLNGRSHPADGTALEAIDIKDGISCALCHRLVDPAPPDGEVFPIDDGIRTSLGPDLPPPDFTGSASMIVDPNDNRRGPFSFNPNLPYHTAYQTAFLGQTGDAKTRARMCGTCHNVSNPVLSWDDGRNQFWPNAMDTPAAEFDQQKLFPIETTFEEWSYSAFAEGGVFMPAMAGDKADGIVETCQDCHLPRQTGIATDSAFNPVYRDCQTTGCLPEHTFLGANTWVPQLLQNPDWRLEAVEESTYLQSSIKLTEQMLRMAATITATLTSNGPDKIANVHVYNNTGHKLPTGYPEGRRIWIDLKAYDGDGNPIAESGAYDPTTGTLIQDPDLKVYEAKQGLTSDLADVLNLPAGESFHFVLNNMVIKDNRIPPRGVTQAEYDPRGLSPVGATYADNQNWDETIYTLPLETEKIIVTLYYQTASKAYIDFLRNFGGVDGQTLGDLWDDLKSPPVIMAQIAFPPNNVYLPLIIR